jgi:hypothetical protein
MVISDWLKAGITMHNRGKTILNEFIGFNKRLLTITDRVQLRFHSIIVATPCTPRPSVSGFDTDCSYGGYILRLVGQVVRVSIEKLKIVKSLPAFRTAATNDRET